MNPKQSLTKLSTLADFAAQPRGGREFAVTAATRAFAKSAAAAPLRDPEVIGQLREHSITSAEELAALAGVKDAKVTAGLRKLGVSRAMCEQMAASMGDQESGAEMLDGWSRFAAYAYATGCEIAFDNPPPAPAQAMAARGSASGGVVVAAATPGTPAGLVSLIDSFMSPIRNQLDRGTCVAFTACACLEYYQNRFCRQMQIDLSEQFAYWDMVQTSNRHALDALWPLLARNGVCRETTWRYNPREIPKNDAQGPAPAAAMREAPSYRCRDVLQFNVPGDVAAIKHAIDQKRVVGIGIPVYASWFESPVVRQFGNITVPLPGEVAEDVGHAVALVGYEDTGEFAGGGYFVVRNSWGDLWASDSVIGPGYGTIPYRYIERFNYDAWCIRA